jgi:hypothetical protein
VPRFREEIERTFSLIRELPKAFRIVDEWDGVSIATPPGYWRARMASP